MNVFISHITEEPEIEMSIKGWIESTFLGNHEVIVSSDPDSMPAGTKWIDEITKAITSSKILILLCSPNSIHRPWINFEAGCGWAQSIPVIPICYGGLTKSELPPSINALQALDFDQNLPDKLFKALGAHLDIKKLPRIDCSLMYSELEKEIEKTEGIEPAATIESGTPKKLSKHQEEILMHIFTSGTELSKKQIAHELGIELGRVEYHFDVLQEHGLLGDPRLAMGRTGSKGDAFYPLSPAGRKYVVEELNV